MDKQLRLTPHKARRVLLTGATGYLGALIACSLLRNTESVIVCLARADHDRQSLLEPMIVEWEATGAPWSAALEARLDLVCLPDTFPGLTPLMGVVGDVDEVIHCAGCLDYFDLEKLELVNVTYTRELLALAQQLEVKRFVYISTAYSSGYQKAMAPEALHEAPDEDPTDYTRTKRSAEHFVGASGVPYLIMRPSILIGHSQTGRYSGKRYGLYQQWMGLERLTCSTYHADFHAVAPELPLNMVHQDCFEEAFLGAYQYMPDDSVIHIVSKGASSPSMRDLWELWFEVSRPTTVIYYPSVDAVPLKEIHMRQRAYLTFAQVNLEIAAHAWEFETTWLDRLRERGVKFHDATLDSVRVCQDRFVSSSDLLAKYHTKYADQFPVRTQYIEKNMAAADSQQNDTQEAS